MPVLLMPFTDRSSNALLIEYDPKKIGAFQAFGLFNNTLHSLNLNKYTQYGFIHVKETENNTGFKVTLINPAQNKILLFQKNIIDAKIQESPIALNTTKSLVCDNKEECIKSFLKDNFLKNHKAQLENDKKSFFSFFSCWYTTKVQDSWTIDDIVNHAKLNNNRSRKVLTNMGLMNNDGEPIGLLTQLNLISKREWAASS